MNPALIAALIHNFALPELLEWLESRRAAGQSIDDAAAIEKLNLDATEGIEVGTAWLTALAARPR